MHLPVWHRRVRRGNERTEGRKTHELGAKIGLDGHWKLLASLCDAIAVATASERSAADLLRTNRERLEEHFHVILPLAARHD